MPWPVVDDKTIMKYVCLCDPAVDRAKMSEEDVAAYERHPTPDSLPLVEGRTPERFRVHALLPEVVDRLQASMLAAVGPEPSKDAKDYDERVTARTLASVKAARQHDLDTVAEGVVDAPPMDTLRRTPQAYVEELAGVVRSLSTGDSVLLGN